VPSSFSAKIKKFWISPSAGMVLFVIFWDMNSVTVTFYAEFIHNKNWNVMQVLEENLKPTIRYKQCRLLSKASVCSMKMCIHMLHG
jgi:hypothetical protein